MLFCAFVCYFAGDLLTTSKMCDVQTQQIWNTVNRDELTPKIVVQLVRTCFVSSFARAVVRSSLTVCSVVMLLCSVGG